jgi:hypothetical protein
MLGKEDSRSKTSPEISNPIVRTFVHVTMYPQYNNNKKKLEIKKKRVRHWWLMPLVACNPSYSGGRDQKDQSSEPAPVK